MAVLADQNEVDAAALDDGPGGLLGCRREDAARVLDDGGIAIGCADDAVGGVSDYPRSEVHVGQNDVFVRRARVIASEVVDHR